MERYAALRATVPASPPALAPAPAQAAAPEPAARIPVAGTPVQTAGAVPVPPSVRPAQPARPPAPETVKAPVKDHPKTVDSWVGSNGQRVLLVDTIRRQVFEVGRDKRESWAYRNVVPGGATYLPNGNVLLVDMGGNRILEIDATTSQPVWTFGGDSTREKQLRGPRAAGRLSNGNTLIVDTGNHRVIEVTAAGDIAWSYGEIGHAGCAHGSLFKPQGAYREKGGNTLIADTANHRIVEINEAGEIVWQYGNHANRLGGGQGSGVNQLSEPTCAIRIEGDHLLVADTGNQRVLEVDEMKNIHWHYRPGAAKGGNPVRDPQGVWRSPVGKTIISGRTGVIEVDSDIKVGWEYHFGAGTREAMAEAWEAAGMPVVASAATAAMSHGQEIPVNLPASFLVVDRIKSRLFEVDKKMQTVWQFTGLVGGERNRLEHPHYAARLANGNTLVADSGHHRVVEVRDNAIVWQFGKRGEEGDSVKHLSNPRSAERTPNGTIAIADYGNRRILEVNAAQECVWRKDNLVAPVYAAKLPRGNVLVVDWGAHVVMEVDDRGMPVWQYGQMGNNGKGANQLFHPEHACRLESGNTLICD
jgi:sugar lactone lactonase YvrE